MLAVCGAALTVAGCTDDTFKEFNSKEGDMAFEVSAPDSWTEGESRSEQTARVSISRIDDSGTPLYLIAEESAVPDSIVSLPASRGAIVGAANFYDSFGLSGICYTGSWTDTDEWQSKWTTNFAHNIKMAKSGQYWQAADTDERLDWLGSGRIRFFAYAPYDADIKAGSLKHCAPNTAGIPTIDFAVAPEVAKQVDLLSTYTDCHGSQGGSVALSFRHALTAVTLRTGEDMLAGTLKSVKLCGVHSKGTHIVGTGIWKNTSAPADYTIIVDKTLAEDSKGDYTPPGQEIAGTTGNLTFLMIPQTLGDDASLVIEFTDDLTGLDRTLTASLKGTTWKAGTRVAYSVNTTGIKIEPVVDMAFEVVKPTKNTREGNGPADIEKGVQIPINGYIPDMRISAYARIYQYKDEGTTRELKMMLPVKGVEYTTDGGTSWADAKWEERKARTNYDDKALGSILVKPRSAFATMQGRLAANAAKGTTEAPYDLSQGGETANCYMVNSPGCYSLPLVYGNATAPDDPSHTYTGSLPDPAKEQYLLKRFIGYDGRCIADYAGFPKITGDLEPVLVWQDAPHLVSNLRIEGDRLCFDVDKNSVCEGNALVAVRGKSDKDIRWSWHIWVTEETWTNTINYAKVVDTDEYSTYSMAPTNLGYCKPHEADETPVQFTLRVQVELPGSRVRGITTTAMTNIEQAIVEGSVAGDNTFYQWGRKDPMLPGIWNARTIGYPSDDFSQFNMDNKPYYPGEYMFAKEDSYDGRTLAESIKRPYRFFMHDNTEWNAGTGKPSLSGDGPGAKWRTHWHGLNTQVSTVEPATIMNYWDTSMDKNVATAVDTEDGGRIPVKSIYDPCPPGFCVPPTNAFRILGTDSRFWTEDFNYTTKDGAQTIKKNIERQGDEDHPIGWTVIGPTGVRIFFPATGMRDMGQGTREVPEFLKGSTNVAHSEVTFVTTASTNVSGSYKDGTPRSSCMIFYIDDRSSYARATYSTGFQYLQDADGNPVTTWTKDNVKKGTVTKLTYVDADDKEVKVTSTETDMIYVRATTNNAYGFTVRPIRTGR